MLYPVLKRVDVIKEVVNCVVFLQPLLSFSLYLLPSFQVKAERRKLNRVMGVAFFLHNVHPFPAEQIRGR